jgi:hypothetical protein
MFIRKGSFRQHELRKVGAFFPKWIDAVSASVRGPRPAFSHLGSTNVFVLLSTPRASPTVFFSFYDSVFEKFSQDRREGPSASQDSSVHKIAYTWCVLS